MGALVISFVKLTLSLFSPEKEMSSLKVAGNKKRQNWRISWCWLMLQKSSKVRRTLTQSGVSL